MDTKLYNKETGPKIELESAGCFRENKFPPLVTITTI